MEKNSTDYRWQLLQLRLSEKRISEAVAFFRHHKIEPILIKGWAAAQNYPKPFERQFSDVDLIIAPEKYDEAVFFLEDYAENYAIDLHSGARHLDSVRYENLFENTKLVKCGETYIRVLRPEDHLRVLCVHWLTDGGENKDRLWDVYHAVANRPNDFDWDRCLKVISQTRRRWIICTIGLAHRYLKLDVKDTPFAGEVGDIPRWVTETVEREWKSVEKLIPLHWCFHNKVELLKQIKKRIPPNPIQATIDMEGEFDNKPRIFYQIGDICYRIVPSFKRVVKEIFNLPA